jgi:hypothetical protein
MTDVLTTASGDVVVERDIEVVILTIAEQGPPGNGADGASAYQVAVANGFVGTEAQWLASLQGGPGDPGDPGATGDTGASAYEAAVANGFVGTEAEWLDSLRGADAVGAGLVNLVESISTAAPNDVDPAVMLTPNNAATDVDLVIAAKGAGALLVQIPDDTVTGGIKRGTRAVDLQSKRAQNYQVASGAYSVVLGGENNRALGDHSIVGGSGSSATQGHGIALGSGAASSGSKAVALNGSAASTETVAINGTASMTRAIGIGGFASAAYAVALCSYSQATASYSVAIGINSKTYAVIGKRSFGCIATSLGFNEAMGGGLLTAATTANATPQKLTFDATAASATNQLALQNYQAVAFTGTVVARQKGALSGVAAWRVEGLINRTDTAASTVLVTSTVTTISNAPAWALGLSADTVNGALSVTFTGAAATDVRVVCNVDTVEVQYS